MPLLDPVMGGMARRIFKWKPCHLNTVDFVMEPTDRPGEFRLLAHDRGRPVIVGICLPSQADAHRLNPPGVRGVCNIVECEAEPGTAMPGGVDGRCSARWIPMKRRTDKTCPNDVFVVERTARNVYECITGREIAGW